MSSHPPQEVITARGHENVTAQHASTFEVTSDDYLTPAGDCILAIDADRTPSDFSKAFLTACQDSAATITVELEAGGHREEIQGTGHPEFTFTNERSMVWRTSEYVDDRTVGVKMEKSAGDIDRELVTALADGAALTVTLSVA